MRADSVTDRNDASCSGCVTVRPQTEGLTHDLMRTAILSTPPLEDTWLKFGDRLCYGNQGMRKIHAYRIEVAQVPETVPLGQSRG